MGLHDDAQPLSVSDDRLGWIGVAEFVPAPDGYHEPWRLPHDEVLAIGNDYLTHRAGQPAGSRMRFHTDAAGVRLDLRAEESSGPLDLLIDERLEQRVRVDGTRGVVGIEWGRNDGVVELWLPHSGRVGIRSIQLVGGSQLVPAAPRLKWAAYGSSITQCADAPGPTETWPALVSRRQEWDLRDLGFAGACYLHPLVAEEITREAPDLAFLCVGINIWERATHDADSLHTALLRFLEVVARSSRAIVVMSPLVSPDRESAPNAVGLTLAAVRAIVERTARAARSRFGIPVHRIDGLGVFDAGEMHLFRDGLHPTPEGYAVMAERLAPLLGAIAPPAIERGSRAVPH